VPTQYNILSLVHIRGQGFCVLLLLGNCFVIKMLLQVNSFLSFVEKNIHLSLPHKWIPK
jgi:hypothetical protein